MKKTIREFVFDGITGCSSGYCVVTGKAQGPHTNGGCFCMTTLSKTQLQIIANRLIRISEKEIDV